MSNSQANASWKDKAAGQVQVEPLLCKSCGLCAEYCPQDLMKPANDIPSDSRSGPIINPAGHVVYEIYDPNNKCTGCGICASVCPEGAVVVYRTKPAGKQAAMPATSSASRKEANRE